MSEWKAKRFWKEVSAKPIEDGFGVFLDARAIRTPAGDTMVLPTLAMAQRLVREWDAQSETVDPNTMPSTRMANAALAKYTIQKSYSAEMIAAYGDSDLLCYRASEPEGLVARQSATWDPYLDWAAKTLGAELQKRDGVIHATQPADAISVLSRKVHEMSNFQLAALHDLVGLSGSLILGLAAVHQFSSDEDLWTASRVDEIWQEEHWGEDEDATLLMEQKHAAFLHAADMFRLS